VSSTAFVLSKDNRRHNSKSQRAMRFAIIYPDPGKGGRGNKAARDGHVSRQMVDKARAVLAASTAKASDIIAGTLSLDKAYAEVKQDAEDSKRLQWDRDRLEKSAPRMRADASRGSGWLPLPL
jgi:hypothetical protein